MMEWAAIVVAEPESVAHVFAKVVRRCPTRRCQKPSGLRPEGCCHSISSWLGVRLHSECQNVGGFVPLLARDDGVTQEVAGSWFDGAERALLNQLSPACRGRTAEPTSVPARAYTT